MTQMGVHSMGRTPVFVETCVPADMRFLHFRNVLLQDFRFNTKGRLLCLSRSDETEDHGNKWKPYRHCCNIALDVRGLLDVQSLHLLLIIWNM